MSPSKPKQSVLFAARERKRTGWRVNFVSAVDRAGSDRELRSTLNEPGCSLR
jgi:hypothetical protein